MRIFAPLDRAMAAVDDVDFRMVGRSNWHPPKRPQE
jgi:hypothetical protein